MVLNALTDQPKIIGAILFFAATPNVLLVEDNTIALHLIETIIKHAGLKFRSALDGETALELAKTNTFDLIITDIGLPGISGYELTHAIRQWEMATTKKPIPIIGLTALDPAEAKQTCLDFGMNAMLCKPFNLEKLQTLLNQYLIT